MLKPTHRIGRREVEARQFDGTDESAEKLAAWIRENGAEVDILRKGTYDYDLHSAFLRLKGKQYDSLVARNYWVVFVAEDKSIFYNVFPSVFTNIYFPLESEVPQEDVSV